MSPLIISSYPPSPFKIPFLFFFSFSVSLYAVGVMAMAMAVVATVATMLYAQPVSFLVYCRFSYKFSHYLPVYPSAFLSYVLTGVIISNSHVHSRPTDGILVPLDLLAYTLDVVRPKVPRKEV